MERYWLTLRSEATELQGTNRDQLANVWRAEVDAEKVLCLKSKMLAA